VHGAVSRSGSSLACTGKDGRIFGVPQRERSFRLEKHKRVVRFSFFSCAGRHVHRVVTSDRTSDATVQVRSSLYSSHPMLCMQAYAPGGRILRELATGCPPPPTTVYSRVGVVTSITVMPRKRLKPCLRGWRRRNSLSGGLQVGMETARASARRAPLQRGCRMRSGSAAR
jgi:hypothetical protein